MQNKSLIIDENFDFSSSNYNEKEVTVFIDTYMSTAIYYYLRNFSPENKLKIYIKNIGKETKTDIELERRLILENDIDLVLDNYRSYKLYTSGLYNYIDAKVGLIADEIQFTTFENTTNIFYINDKTCDDVLAQNIDLVVFITTWAGLYREYPVSHNESTSSTLHRILKTIKAAGIPIAFYSKEDPPNFNHFAQFTSYADMIFTSSLAKIPEYQELNHKASVKNFTYGINPSHCAPITNEHQNNKFMFAGTWWNEKYQSRVHATKSIFEYVVQNRLDFTFYNRNYYRNLLRFKLPDKYKVYEQPALPYNELVEIYQNFQYHFNLNSVINDETMFAVRVLELQGIGKKIISNYSLPIYVDYPNISIFDENLNLDFPIEDKILGIRNTFEQNSIFDFWTQVFTQFNLEYLIIPNTITYVKQLSALEKLDLEIGFKIFDVAAIAFTENEAEYYSQINYSPEVNVVAKIEDNTSNKILLLPVSKYYKYNKYLVVANLVNYEQVAMLDCDKYIIAIDAELQNRRYINDLFKDFELLSNYTIRNRRAVHQNMECLALINLLNYVHNIELVELIDGKILKVGKIDKHSISFKQFVTQYKQSINDDEYMKVDYKQLVYKIK